MRATLLLSILAAVVAAGMSLSTQAQEKALDPTQEVWLLSIDRWGNAEHQAVTLELSNGRVTGTLGQFPIEGRIDGSSLEFALTDRRGDAYRFIATLDGDTLSGTAVYPDTNTSGVRVEHGLVGRRLPPAPADGPSRRFFEPTSFSNTFTSEREPVMVLWPGDVVTTSTVDSGGVDHEGETQALYGNPQTGPFYVSGAKPGDVLAIHIRRLDLTRDYADSLNGLTGRAMTTRLAAKAKDLGQRVRWQLDRDAGVARLENPPAALENYRVPLRPMLGGLAVAPDFGYAPASAGDTGRFGGNMDWNGLVAGVTVYLPVYQPGALLYLGDGHALQGDGETTQWALETSLEVEFSVDVLPARSLSTPRAESDSHITAIGQAGSLDDALRSATAGMIQWLEQDYGLDVEASSLILGSAAEYRVVTLASRNAGIALSLPKALLEPITESITDPTSPRPATPRPATPLP